MTLAATALLSIHLFATAGMVGLIWFVQVVHYPLFSRVGAVGFADVDEADGGRVDARLPVEGDPAPGAAESPPLIVPLMPRQDVPVMAAGADERPGWTATARQAASQRRPPA